ncbi:MAG: SusD/RagB family nutrient-binding outer membrane lipoprotein [Bacteroidales bacterium]|nr:SusD/RagB family nutrient-binding outer membrane lipoprotein [Bacteroidales bacterium]
MRNLYKYIIIGFAAAGMLLSSCTGDFEKFNTNPYEPTSLPVTSFFPGMIDCLASPEENPCQRNNTFWACFGGYVTASNSWNRSTLFATFNVDDDWNKWSVDWYFSDQFYPNWFSVARLTEYEGYYYQMAQLLRIYTMSMVLSFQGPLPYSNVAEGNFYVAYDDEETAWHAMFDDLDVAIEAINQAIVTGETPLSSVDRVYSGSNTAWLKFANTLKLRMAMRISSVDAAYAQQKAEEAVASGVMENTSDSAYDNLNGRYPNGYYQVGGAWGEVKANACITSYMNGYNDPRREKYFTETSGQSYTYNGIRSGIPNIVAANFTGYSGLIYENNNTAPMPIMYAAEAWFLRAEGALKGWNMGGNNAQYYYEQGIRSSFDEWGASGADDYIADNTSTPANYTDPNNASYSCTNKSTCTIAWDDSASDAQKLERIITQKWIANYPNGLEGWSDFRRTGYPYIFPPQTNLSSVITDAEHGQRRLRFSQTEYDNNSANVQDAVQMLSNKQDTDATELWWATTEDKY